MTKKSSKKSIKKPVKKSIKKPVKKSRKLVKKSQKKNNSGYCVYFFAHRGIGRMITQTKNMTETRQKLKLNNDVGAIGCHSDLKIAKQKYNENMKKMAEKKRQKIQNKTPEQKLKEKNEKNKAARILYHKRKEFERKQKLKLQKEQNKI